MKSFTLLVVLCCATVAAAADQWPQLQGDSLRSGNHPETVLPAKLGLVGAVPLTDGIYAAPVIADGKVYAIDGAGVVTCLDASSLKVLWTFATRGGAGNCNNVAAPAISGKYLHVGTTAGYYYVLDRESGEVVRELDCQEPIFSAPAAGNGRVYFATLGAQVYAVEPDGTLVWTWDFVKEVVKFTGNRWSGEDWLKERQGRVNWRDHFVCSRDICLIGKTVVIPAGGRTVFLDDAGANPQLRVAGEIPAFDGSEFPATFGQSADAAGNVYVQWHRRDNAGRVEILKLDGEKLKTDFIKNTQTAIQLPGLLSFAAVSIRGNDVYRVRPEQGLGLCRHTSGQDQPTVLCPAASICPPVLTRDHAIYGGLDGKLYVVPLAGGEPTSLATAHGSALTAPVAVAAGRIFAPCEDGYLYVFGADGNAPLPTKNLDVAKIRSPLTGKFAAAKYDWYTNYGDFGSTNANLQDLAPPLRMRWARRLEGTVKHLPVCGGGRMYSHTAEGQIIAVEQDTGRLLWRRYWPDVYLSFTSPLYYDGTLLIPQAGMKRSVMRCLDAATGELLWEAPFTGSPSWSRQFPPVVHGNLAIYASGSGEYAPQGTEKPYTFKGAPQAAADGREVMSWIYSNDNPYYPKDNRPLLWAWDLDTGKVVWQKDFSEHGRGGNDCGICLLDGKLFYSTFFGYSASHRARRGLPPENNGLTACLEPKTGEVVWLSNKHFVTAKCTLTGKDGRIYIGGFNPAKEDTKDRFVWCLDAKDGSLIWQSDVVTSALNVVTVGDQFIFSNALRGRGNVFDRQTGKVVGGVDHNYACCRFTMSGSYILGANMDMIDLAAGSKLVSTGPAIDSRECLGAIVSNGRIFYMSQASGFVVSQTYGEESKRLPAVWERP
ncbi:outer membrane biogenesis protein BamB [Anatilimnocola aggregata]|uniref:Outer membrane biogenesis protein BamB n=1 Tax=Anatilimnocola aggregata TaxID=2528021 RepID=A0A517YAB0_9BACT|nr:PQQ-binding-like beta-propeller repeat protein [Anatilimnocola aggregata]QDU27154.1 outer membrane biogenesis protein BamB [Anatilimnocola aggregata]